MSALPGALAVTALTDFWDGYQLDSTFGRPDVRASCSVQSADWGNAAPFPLLETRSDLPELRVVTYNLHSGLGPRWRVFASRREVERNLAGIADRIAAAASPQTPVDVVALNEVDFGSRRSGWMDQAAFLAAELERRTGHAYAVARGETWRRDVPGLEVRFGNAVLFRHSALSVDARMLEETQKTSYASAIPASALDPILSEPRGVLRVRIRFFDRPVDLLVTHLEAFNPARRETQAAALLQKFVEPGRTSILLGDMNTVPTAMTYKRPHLAADRTHDVLTSGDLTDARVAAGARDGANDFSDWATYPAQAPVWPLDGSFATPDLVPQAVRVIGSDESDHRGLSITYKWLTPEATSAFGRWHDTVRRRQLARLFDCDISEPDPVRNRHLEWLKSNTGYLNLSARDNDARGTP
ncbi:endonuclease/exonuclease/phosphatase family protein [Methylocaldum sp.]|uniref:endonuclease/exonuclease/phosphatase family protein n=1 Tax=Methylocaldum sp. TaxID=1969727 RepID=UPI002D23BF43|nr:endonuclease/exonuclease/phosphatase family protein [Methylocaldum sp.]HYE34202.1 endonuclease/exonuclease/phosphatase family protein [Methylocaldum sp.]